MSNGEVLEIANREKRILITNDNDFGEIVFHQRMLSYGIILFRVKSQKIEKKIHLLSRLLSKENISKIRKQFVVITENKVRFIPMEV